MLFLAQILQSAAGGRTNEHKILLEWHLQETEHFTVSFYPASIPDLGFEPEFPPNP